MTLQDIITTFEGAIELYGRTSYNADKYQMEVILILAKEIQELKDYVRQNVEDL